MTASRIIAATEELRAVSGRLHGLILEAMTSEGTCVEGGGLTIGQSGVVSRVIRAACASLLPVADGMDMTVRTRTVRPSTAVMLTGKDGEVLLFAGRNDPVHDLPKG